MKKNVLKMLWIFGVCVGTMSPLETYGMMRSAVGARFMRASCHVAVTAAAVTAAMTCQVRHHSDLSYKGEHISVDENGLVTISQPLYPNSRGEQRAYVLPKKIGDVQYDKSSGMPYYLVEYPSLVKRTAECESLESIVKFFDESIGAHSAHLAKVNAEEIAQIQKREQEAEVAKQALRAEGKAEVARSLKTMGLTVDQIKTATGLTEEQIATL